MNRRMSVAWRARPARKDDLTAWRLRKDGGDFPAFAIDSPDHKTLAVVATRALAIRIARLPSIEYRLRCMETRAKAAESDWQAAEEELRTVRRNHPEKEEC